MDEKLDDLNPILSKITRPVTAIKSLRFALLDPYYIDVSMYLYCTQSQFLCDFQCYFQAATKQL